MTSNQFMIKKFYEKNEFQMNFEQFIPINYYIIDVRGA